MITIYKPKNISIDSISKLKNKINVLFENNVEEEDGLEAQRRQCSLADSL